MDGDAMTAAIINFKDLATWPLPSLQRLALATARDIDQGTDKRDLLNRIFNAIQKDTRYVKTNKNIRSNLLRKWPHYRNNVQTSRMDRLGVPSSSQSRRTRKSFRLHLIFDITLIITFVWLWSIHGEPAKKPAEHWFYRPCFPTQTCKIG